MTRKGSRRPSDSTESLPVSAVGEAPRSPEDRVGLISSLRAENDALKSSAETLKAELVVRDRKVEDLEKRLAKSAEQGAAERFGLAEAFGDAPSDTAVSIVEAARLLIADFDRIRGSREWRSSAVSHNQRLKLLGMRTCLRHLGFDDILDMKSPEIPDTIAEMVGARIVQKTAASGMAAVSRGRMVRPGSA